MTGQELLAFLRELRATTPWPVAVDDASVRWQLSGLTWQATVIVDPRRWLGVEFEARDPATGKLVTYDIDTDLYDISHDKYREFAAEIERDIIEFLGNLRTGAMLRGTDGALVFPLDGSWIRVVRGRFLTSASTHADLAEARRDGDYVVVR
ncbi:MULTISPECIES: hypothetical protein [Amycolatopsis]|uniref:Uncharacterized protein n=1 Tax=Amycolatopsis dendrobii TaxID=2760662 RepID=A0A7W3ZAF9_9PSEU|nr:MULTISPECIES: hypothetical protein [Amycolatopsis]MBB1154421.1 hypothetical protein [Amycolatopsis dendrobii]UKD51203.1 hypothetical protein L3Q65_25065 [Amycolatopsis sp. FU40]